jgi:hypothetical protein
MSGPIVFVSYARADNQGGDPAWRWLDRLLQQLRPLAFQEVITVAADRDIALGEDWHARIQADLERAQAAVLLVSPAFLASEYIRNSELPVLLRRASGRGLKIIPVVLRPCLFAETRFRYPDPTHGPQELTLSSLQATGSPERALNQMEEGEQDEALLRVARTLLAYARDAAQATGGASKAPRQPRVDLRNLPRGADHFLGRQSELSALDRAWDQSGRTEVVELIAPWTRPTAPSCCTRAACRRPGRRPSAPRTKS